MKVETKFNIGERVCFLWGIKIISCQIEEIRVAKTQEGFSFTYGFFWNEEMHYVNESRVFHTPGMLLADFWRNIESY